MGELESSDEFRVTEHGSRHLARRVVVDGQGLVRAGGGGVGAGGVEDHLDKGPVVALASLERLGVLAGVHSVHTDVSILTRRQNLLIIMLKKGENGNCECFT